MNGENTSPGEPRLRRWGMRKRLATGLNVSASLALAVAVAALANYLAAKHFRYRTDISHEQFYTLSKKTESMLAGLKGNISVHIVFRTSSSDDFETVQDIKRMLEEYRQIAARKGALNISVEKIDPDRDLARIEDLRR